MKKPIDRKKAARRGPLYLQIEEKLRQEISAMKPGDGLPPERLIAQQYGVSLITVREAIRILAEEGRLERVQGKGTFVSHPGQATKDHVALLIHHDISHPRTSPLYLSLTQEIRFLLDTHGISSRLYISRRPPGLAQADFHCPEFFEDLEAGRVKGVIGVLLAGKAPWIETLKAKGITLVGYGISKDIGAVGDLASLYTSAISEFIRRGKRKIALLAWRGVEGDDSRQAAVFRAKLQEAGLPVVDAWIRDDTYPTLDGAGWGGFREIWSATSQRPDALILADDFFMGGLTVAIREMGIRVPEQLEVAANIISWQPGMQPFPILAWRPDLASLSRAIVDAERQILRGEMPEPAFKRIPHIRTPEWDTAKLPTSPVWQDIMA